MAETRGSGLGELSIASLSAAITGSKTPAQGTNPGKVSLTGAKNKQIQTDKAINQFRDGHPAEQPQRGMKLKKALES